MATQIDFTDTVGAATLTNGKSAPGDRFMNWVPTPTMIGPAKDALGTGIVYAFRFRTDYGASFELAHIPASSLDICNRLILHLLGGGNCSIATGDSASNTYSVCGIRPRSTPSLTLDESDVYEYRLALELIRLDGTAAAMSCLY